MKEPKRHMIQLAIDKDTLFDLKNYAKENGFNYGDLVRQLIHNEVYQAQRLAKKPKHDKS